MKPTLCFIVSVGNKAASPRGQSWLGVRDIARFHSRKGGGGEGGGRRKKRKRINPRPREEKHGE